MSKMVKTSRKGVFAVIKLVTQIEVRVEVLNRSGGYGSCRKKHLCPQRTFLDLC